MCKLALAAAIVIRLVKADRVPENVLRGAEAVAASIFARAGVRVEWSDCRFEKCAGSGLWLQFLDQRRGTAGYAVIGGYAVIRYPVVEEAAKDLQVDAAVMLGASLAHEVGHLLLGKRHGRGVMSRRLGRAEVDKAAQGELGFTAEEARRIRQMPPTAAAR
jgi:hypothetical protein